MRALAIYNESGRDIVFYDDIVIQKERHIVKDGELIKVNPRYVELFLNGKIICYISDNTTYRLLSYKDVVLEMNIVPPSGFKPYEL